MKRILSLLSSLLVLSASLPGAETKPLVIPDFTKGDAIPATEKHDWNLGPTGARGWMFSDHRMTIDARQISITRVEKGSPADGVLAVGDVLLGVGGKAFSYDPRTEFEALITVSARRQPTPSRTWSSG